MNTISEYVITHMEVSPSGTNNKIARLRERAEKHRSESARLVRMGDPRQAELHASIARTHLQSAWALEQDAVESAH